MRVVEVIARGVCVVEGQVLLCRGRSGGPLYLPGGHIEFGESGARALEREIEEEMGRVGRAGRFLGCCEHRFVQGGEDKSEINLVFELVVNGVVPGVELEAAEDWIAFSWHALDKLDEIWFEPAALGRVLVEWLEAPGGHIDSSVDMRY